MNEHVYEALKSQAESMHRFALMDENIKLKIVLGEQIEEITDVEIEKLNKNESYWVDITMPDGSSYSCSSLQKNEGEQARLTDASNR